MVRAMTTEQAANYLGVAASTLTKWRSIGRTTLPFIKIGRSVRYRQIDLDEYMDQHRFGGDDSEAA